MKVLMADASVGNEYALCLCSGLNTVGVDISLVVTEDREIRKPVDFPLKYWAPSKNPGFSKVKKTIHYVKYLVYLLIYIKKNNIKVVHFQFFRRERIENLYYLLLRLLGVNVVFTAHDIFPHTRYKIDYPLRSIVYRASKAIIAHSQHIKEKLKEEFNVENEKVYTIPHGDYDNYLPAKPLSKSEARESLKLGEDDQVILFFGFIKEYKGLGLLLDAFQIASGKNPRLKLVIAGMPETENLAKTYRDQIANIETNDRITAHFEFIPSEKIASYMTASDVVVLPYNNIYHSGIVHLAYSFERPLIATRVGDFEETIEHDKTGYLLEKNDAKTLADTLNMAFSDSRKLETMGKYAKNLSETKYSWTNAARLTRELYEKMI